MTEDQLIHWIASYDKGNCQNFKNMKFPEGFDKIPIPKIPRTYMRSQLVSLPDELRRNTDPQSIKLSRIGCRDLL
jgi:hypothetical protein